MYTKYIVHCSCYTLLMYFLAVGVITLNLDANSYHIRVKSEQLRNQSQFPLKTLTLSRPLLDVEFIAEASVLGQDSNVYINSSTLTIYLTSSVLPGRQNMFIVVIIGNQSSPGVVLSAPLTIDIIAEGMLYCSLIITVL